MVWIQTIENECLDSVERVAETVYSSLGETAVENLDSRLCTKRVVFEACPYFGTRSSVAFRGWVASKFSTLNDH